MVFLFSSLAFVLKHLICAVLAAVVAGVCWVVVYFGLLIWAMIGDAGVGSPLALPVGLLFILCGVFLLCVAVFAPACAAGRVFCYISGLPDFSAIPVVLVVAVLVSSGITQMIDPNEIQEVSDMVGGGGFLIRAALISVPLGIYWWMTEGTSALVDAVKRWHNQRSINAE